jgi:alanyl-tRNA synthetase
MTERLYYANTRLLRFTAQVQELTTLGDHIGVVLDQTAFYPTGGGQLHDVGILGGVPVIDVVEDEAGDKIIHLVAAEPEFRPGDEVAGEVDERRRIDFMQQHTGQHILSQAFIRVAGIETRSVHMGEEFSTVDLAMEQPDESLIRQAEELANQIVFEDREVKFHQVAPEELSRFPLRKEPAVIGCARIIEISDFDWSPCGGTHAHRTGEVGLIAVRGWERAKRMCRVEFVCGSRALRDYRLANDAAKFVSLMLTTARDDIADKVARLIEENKQQSKRIRELAAIAAEVEAGRLYEEAEEVGTFRLVARVLADRSSDEARLLARKLVERSGVAVLFGVREAATARLIFARSADLATNMSELIRSVCQQFDGRGGGAPDLAQGAIKDGQRLDRAIAAAVDAVKRTSS